MRTLLHAVAKQPAIVNKSVNIADREQLLANINSDEVKMLYPLIVFYAVILIVGVIGNSLVLLVYSVRYQRSPARVYIIFLAAIDLSICLFGLPYHIIDLTHPYNFNDAITCKALTFIITTLFHMSIFVLIVISIDRCLKICKPLGNVQLSYFGKKRSCVGAAIAAVLLSWPNLILYGRNEVVTPHVNVTGYACYFDTKYENTNYPFIYIMVTLCVCIFSTVFLLVAYSLICRQIFTRYQIKNVPLCERSACDEVTLASDDVILKQYGTPDFGREFGSYVHGSAKSAHTNRSNIINKMITNHDISFPNDAKSTDEIYRSRHVNANYSSDDSLLSTEDQCMFNNMNKATKGMQSVICSSDLDVIEPFLTTGSSNIACANQKPRLLRHSALGSDVNPDPVTNCDDSNLGKRLTPDLRMIHCTCKERICVCSSAMNSLPNLNQMFSLQRNFQMVFGDSSCSESASSFDVVSRKSINKSVNKVFGNLKLKNTRAECQCRRSSDQTGVSRSPNTKCKRCAKVAAKKQRHSWGTTDNTFLRINTSRDHITATSKGAVKHKNVISKQNSKITKIMFIITLTFIVSYSPALVITIWTILQPNVWDLLDDNWTIVFELFLRFYLVNNICNPFIYGFWDKRFKMEVIYTFSKLLLLISGRCGCCTNKNR